MRDPVEEGHTIQVFVHDVKTAFSAWRVAPWLPAITAGLTLVGGVGFIAQGLLADPTCVPGQCSSLEIQRRIRVQLLISAASLTIIPIGLFNLGWNGTERIWYLRIFRARSLSRREGWNFSWSFLGRFLVLGLLISLVLIPVYLLAFWSVFARIRSQPGPPTVADLRFWPVVISSVVVLVVEFGLTFVTPALAYTTRRITDAMRIGLRMIKDTWPRCALYVLVPPLAVTILSRFLPSSVIGVWLRLALLPTSALVNLLFKGATAAFYLRRVDVGDNGAVRSTPAS